MSWFEQNIAAEPVEQAWFSIPSVARKEPCCLVIYPLEKESPGSACVCNAISSLLIRTVAQHNRSVWFKDNYRQRRRFWIEPDRIALLHALPLWDNPIGILHMAPHEILKPCVAVESGAGLPNLHKPGPHILHRGVDCDRMSRLILWMWHKVVGGQTLVGLGARC